MAAAKDTLTAVILFFRRGLSEDFLNFLPANSIDFGREIILRRAHGNACKTNEFLTRLAVGQFFFIIFIAF